MVGRSLTICLVLFSHLAGAAPGLKGFALCFGLNGHVELKDLRSPACAGVEDHGDSEGPAAEEPAALQAPDDCCEGCIDIPLGSIELPKIRRLRPRRLAGPEPTAAGSSPLAACPALPRPPCDPAGRPGHPQPIPHNPISTTVLLI